MGNISSILQSGNQTRVAKAQYRAKVASTANTNKLAAAESSFGNFMRTLGNKARVNAAAKEYNFAMDQLAEEIRAASGANFNSQLSLANARGALAAQAGYVGVGGSSVDLMDTMVRLQGEMDVEAKDNAVKLLASRGQKQAAQIVSNAYSAMDMRQAIGNFDFSQYVEPKAMKNRFLALVGAGVATYFGGPLAGDAVAGLAVGDWQASNGDFQGAARTFGSSIANIYSAGKDFAQSGNTPWAKRVQQGMIPADSGTTDYNILDTRWGKDQGGTFLNGIGWGEDVWRSSNNWFGG